MNAIDFERKLNKINKVSPYPAAHNGLVAGSRTDMAAKKSCGRTSLRTRLILRIRDGSARLPFKSASLRIVHALMNRYTKATVRFVR
jgi:hypothetical protein